MKAPILTLATLLLAPGAVSANGNFPVPPNVSVVGNVVSSGRVPDCRDKVRLTNYYKDLRQRARQGYARKVAEAIPTLVPGTKCINSKEAYDAQYMSSGDYFLISCLAETKGTLTHLYTMELISEIPPCFSDQTIQNFVDSGQCQRPGETEMFERMHLLSCPMQMGPMAKFRGSSGAYPINVDYFNRLVNARPSVQNIVDGRDFRVKIGPSRPSGSDCNQGGCLPTFGGSRDAR